MHLRVLVAAVAVLVAVVAAAGWLILTPAPGVANGPRMVEIPAHEGLLQIAGRLAEAHVIRSPVAFLALSVARGSGKRLKAGEYEIPRGAGTNAVLALLESGKVKQHTVLHPEGATVAELARALESERLVSAPAFLRAARDPALLKTLGIEGESVEGYLFPDTYQLVRGMAPEEIVSRMVQRLRAKLTPEVLARARERGLTVHRLLTLASIVEREAVAREEVRLISAVFWNRLRLDMPLQADPTVQYALGKERRALTRADLQIDHPFNTYRRPGLPPGPIASPGLQAIAAALDPAPVNYLYFVKIDERRHHFSTTVQEHNAAVIRYRLARARS